MQKYKPLFKYRIVIRNRHYWFETTYQTNSFLGVMFFLAKELRKNKYLEIITYHSDKYYDWKEFQDVIKENKCIIKERSSNENIQNK